VTAIVVLFPELQSLLSMLALSQARTLTVGPPQQRRSRRSLAGDGVGSVRQCQHMIFMFQAALVTCICFSNTAMRFSGGRAPIYFHMVCTCSHNLSNYMLAKSACSVI
jgi:hypothetical protein